MSWISNAIASVGNFVKKEIGLIEGAAPEVESALEDAATIANNLVNGLKTYVESPDGKAVLTVIENVPGVGPYVGDVIQFLPTLLIDLGWAKAEFTKSPADIVHDGVTAAINAATPNIKATNLITLQSHLNTEISSLAQKPISIQAAVALAPAVYDGIATDDSTGVTKAPLTPAPLPLGSSVSNAPSA